MSLESFADLTYPGGKKPRRVAPVPAKDDAPRWDAKPVKKLLRSGDEIELFPVGMLGMALGRAAVTMRLWEREGVIPKATFRLPARNGVNGRRYYTREQIEGIQRIAEEEGLLGNRGPLTKDFTTKCIQLFADLKKGSNS